MSAAGPENNLKTIDVCVCTFRRPAVIDTLNSIENLTCPDGYAIGIIVVDNDEVPSAKTRVETFASGSCVPTRYLHRPARNISIARNGCLDASHADFIAFIDDDEIASEIWLERLVRMMEKTDCDAVLGPVRALYADNAPEWMKKIDLHSTKPDWVHGEIRVGYTCNVLLRMASPYLAGRRFSLSRGQTGGEDTAYFDGMYQDGGKITFAGDAWVEEAVPPQRATAGWLLKRRFRVGQTHGTILAQKQSIPGLLRHSALASAKVFYCFVHSLVSFFDEAARNRAALRGVMHVGVLSGLWGIKELRQYGFTPTKGKSHGAA